MDGIKHKYININGLVQNCGNFIINSSDAIWQVRSRSTMVQVLAWCLMAPSHYWDKCWLLISEMICGIHLRTISQEMLKRSILDMSLELIWNL